MLYLGISNLPVSQQHVESECTLFGQHIHKISIIKALLDSNPASIIRLMWGIIIPVSGIVNIKLKINTYYWYFYGEIWKKNQVNV